MELKTFISQLCEHCGIDATSLQVEVTEDGERLYVTIQVSEEDSGAVIGFHGEGLESIQRVVRIVFHDTYPNKKIMLNINDYRQNREQRLREIVDDVAQRVIDTHQPYEFQSFIPSYERFIIHTILSESEEYSSLESVSHGEGKNRKLTIQLKQS